MALREEVLHEEGRTTHVVAGDGVVVARGVVPPSITNGMVRPVVSSHAGAANGEIARIPSTWRSTKDWIAR